MKTERGWWALAGFSAPILLIAMYVGGYFVSVTPEIKFGFSGSPPVVVAGGVTPAYRAIWMESFFAPIHRIDRDWIRPGVWRR
jgi:hypothetical protein